MKIGLVNYNWNDDGVTRVVLNNYHGLRETHSNVSIKLIGGVFPGISEPIETCSVPMKDKAIRYRDILNGLESASQDCDVVVFENPVLGSSPNATKAFKEFSEKTGKKVLWRHHDFVYDRPQYQPDFLKVFENLDDGYARTDNVSHLALVSFNQKRMRKAGIDSVVFPNSVIADNFKYDPERGQKLRKHFESEGIINPGEKMLIYPGRVLRRKNIEEALLLTRMIGNGDKWRLVVTLPHANGYTRELEEIAKDCNVSCSLGQAGQHIKFGSTDPEDFTISDLFSSGGVSVGTSVDEGFGFTFVEPWLAGNALIGRNLPRVTADFKNNGMQLDHLYDSDVFPYCPDETQRNSCVKHILGDKTIYNALKKQLDLDKRIENANATLEHNNRVVREVYDYIPNAERFYEILSK